VIRLAILDYGMGNLRSVEKALEHVGVRAEVTRDHDAVRRADGLVLPGVGAFPRAMAEVHRLGFDALLRERLEGGTPVLGICLGMQLLFDRSDEGDGPGLGIVAGKVTRLRAERVPQIGWNQVEET
jgi:imidazole glycerol-phosphate synthase subunit HisH